MDHRRFERSIPEIIGDLLTQFPALARKESQLARAEISEKISQAAFGLAFIVVGAVLLIPALVVLLQAAVAALEQGGFQPTAAALIAGGAALLIGVIFLLVGINRLKVGNLVPNRTIHQIQEDASVAKQQLRPGHEHQRAA
ncbi:phage holin family protein [Bradyrhizobium sp. RDT10]